MTLIVVTPPAPIVTIDEVRRQLKLADSGDDQALHLPMLAACSYIEPPDSWVGRAFGVQTLEYRVEDWPRCWGASITLLAPPVRSLTSVKYDDADGAEQTLDPSVYRVYGLGGTGPVRVSLANGQSWPGLLCGDEAIRIRYVAGYDPDDPQITPAKQAVLAMVSLFNEQRGTGGLLTRESIPGVIDRQWFLSDATRAAADQVVGRLLGRYQVWL